MKKSYPKRGFASMDKEKHRKIASRGGKTAQALGVGHRFTHEEAVAAGKLGGRGHTREHMRALAHKAVKARWGNWGDKVVMK